LKENISKKVHSEKKKIIKNNLNPKMNKSLIISQNNKKSSFSFGNNENNQK